MLHVSFNQDSTCFVCSKENGFVVYNCDPLTERFSRLTDEEGGLGIVEMLFRSNIFALVGGGAKPRYPPNMLMIWDDFQSKCIAELEFSSPVTGIKLCRDRILVTIVNKAYLYNFDELSLLKSYETFSNPLGVSAMTSDNDGSVIAVPGNVAGTVIIDNGTHCIITAHSNALAAIALNANGTTLATASERGTLIRTWDTMTGQQLREFRRGLEVVNITSLAFDRDTTRLLVCSDKGTAHIYSLLNNPETSTNRRSSLSYISGYLPSYFGSEWSTISFEVPSGSICTFSSGSVDTVYVVTPERFLKYTYNSSECLCLESIEIK